MFLLVYITANIKTVLL